MPILYSYGRAPRVPVSHRWVEHEPHGSASNAHKRLLSAASCASRDDSTRGRINKRPISPTSSSSPTTPVISRHTEDALENQSVLLMRPKMRSRCDVRPSWSYGSGEMSEVLLSEEEEAIANGSRVTNTSTARWPIRVEDQMWKLGASPVNSMSVTLPSWFAHAMHDANMLESTCIDICISCSMYSSSCTALVLEELVKEL